MKDTAECYLYGNHKRSLMGHYRGMDDLGIITANQWYVLGLGVRNSKRREIQKTKRQAYKYARNRRRRRFFRIDQDLSRGIVEVNYIGKVTGDCQAVPGENNYRRGHSSNRCVGDDSELAFFMQKCIRKDKKFTL